MACGVTDSLEFFNGTAITTRSNSVQQCFGVRALQTLLLGFKCYDSPNFCQWQMIIDALHMVLLPHVVLNTLLFSIFMFRSIYA